MAYYFNLPMVTDLTICQQAALNEIKAIAVTGGPGSGKSVVSLWRHIQNHSLSRRNSLLLTYTKSLEIYLSQTAGSQSQAAGENVDRTYRWTTRGLHGNYDEIIIDEAQDVEIAKYKQIKNCTNMVSYSADDNQILYPTRQTTEDQLKDCFPENNSCPLDENFRNSYEITHLVKSLFFTRVIIDGKDNGPKPTLVCTDNNDEVQKKVIFDVIKQYQSETHNIAVLVPRAEDVIDWYDILINYGVNSCSKYESKSMQIGKIENIHVTTFKSSKGLEFDTVIIPDFDNYNKNIRNLRVITENDYYVALTRTKRNLVLIDNGNTDSNNVCKLVFLESQINSGLVEVDYDYL